MVLEEAEAMKLLPVLAFSANDAIQCERLLDLLALFRKRQPVGDLLLVAAPDTHQETRLKTKIAAEVAFEHVDLLEVGWPKVAHTSKTEAVNDLWYQGMTHATRCYQWPALWLEPDVVCLRPHWLEELEMVYFNQAKRYLGSILSSGDGKVKVLSRVAIYPRGCAGEMKEFTAGKLPFELAAGPTIVPRAGKSRLFQQTPYTSTTDRSVIRPEAVILHSDKESVLLSELIDKYSELPQYPETIFADPPPFNQAAPEQSSPNGEVGIIIEDDPEPAVDKRTKTYREWKLRQETAARTSASETASSHQVA